MTLERAVVLAGIRQELAQFADLIGSTRTADLDRPTRCTGWTVGHVAGHVIGTVVDVARGRLEGQGTAAVNERQARERLGRSPGALVEELDVASGRLCDLLALVTPDAWEDPAVNNPAYSTGFAIEAIWYDAYLHGDDIRTALGLESARGSGLVCALEHTVGYLAHQDRSLVLELDGLERVEIGRGGEHVSGDPLRFVLVATGREDPATLGVAPWINVYAT